MSSDTATENTPATTPDAAPEATNAAPAAPAREFSDAERMMLDHIRSIFDQANTEATVVLAASNEGQMVHNIRDENETDDKNILTYRKRIEQLDALREDAVRKIDGYIRENLLPKSDASDVEGARERYNTLKTRALGGLDLLGITVSDLPEDFPKLRTLRGGNVSEGTKGQPKPRVRLVTFKDKSGNTVEAVKETEKDGKTVRTSNFTTAAQMISKVYGGKVEATDLSAATFEAAGTQDLKSVPGREFTFSTSVNGANVEVTVYTPSA
jgi:hypothetical protein